jgi:hypothetical protein
VSIRGIVSGITLLALLAGCQGGAATTKQLTLSTLNNSGVTGTVNLTDVGGGKTQVTIAATPNGNNQMLAHIHEGTCATLNPAPKYPLNDVVSGASTTTVTVALTDLTKSAYAVNLHKSKEDAKTYTACADIK